MVRIQGPPNTKEVGFKVSDLIFMKYTALVVECLFTEMHLLSLGEGFIFHKATVFTYTCGLPLHDDRTHRSCLMWHIQYTHILTCD